MTDLFAMFDLPTLKVLHNATSSRASVSGRTRPAPPAGQTTGLYGLDHAPASRSATQEREAALMMTAISGQSSIASSASVALQLSLANRLADRLAGRGSTLYHLTWKAQATPSRRLICALLASVRRTSGSDYTGWATPAKRDYRTPNHKSLKDRGGGSKGEQLQNQVAHLIPGASLSGLDVGTGKLGLLSPRMSLWLQGIPPAWLDHAPRSTTDK